MEAFRAKGGVIPDSTSGGPKRPPQKKQEGGKQDKGLGGLEGEMDELVVSVGAAGAGDVSGVKEGEVIVS